MKKITIAFSLLLLMLNSIQVAAQTVTQNSEPFSVNLHEVNQQNEIGLKNLGPARSVQLPASCCKSIAEFQNVLGGAGLYYLFDGYTRTQITSQNLASVVARLKDKTKAVNLTVNRVKNS
ncbi:MAG: hypothetical protein JSR85_00455 [Proteobacteria bacterium]|nr:hypothetical protein [Pseudomonadota bacterium]